MIRLSEIQIK